MNTKTCTLTIRDTVNAKFDGLDPVLRRKFLAALKVMVPHARHTPQYKLKRWDGMVAFGTVGGGTYVNLLDRVLPMVVEAGYEVEVIDKRPVLAFDFPDVTENFVADRFWPPGHPAAGEPIMLRDYQVAALRGYFANPQSLQCISTGAGKTLMTACMSLSVEQASGGRSIVIVPSTSLVQQTEEDYRNLGLDVGVFYGDRKEWGNQHIICTWQSLSVFSKRTLNDLVEVPIEDFLHGVNCVIVDECHSVKGNELKELLCGPMAHIPIRWGLTGTIPKGEWEFLPLLSSIGPVVGEIRADRLQDQGVLANCDIEILELQDKHVEFDDYDSEYKYLTTDKDRLRWIGSYCDALSESGNTLILVQNIQTGKMLSKLIPGSIFISGEVKSKARAEEYKSVQTSTNKLIIATYGVAAVGINIPRIFQLVLFEPGKSFVRVIQSIGRGLRKAGDKDAVKITDFTSSLKFSKRHAGKRKEFYTDAGYPFTVTKVIYREAPLF